MPILERLTKGRVAVKAWTADLEPEARRQLENVANLPIVHGHVAAMPDVHAGIGATVGSVIPTRGAIIPAAVGVDIGCGMNAVRLTLSAKDLPDSLARIRSAIEAAVPVGFDQHDECPLEDRRELRALARRLDAVAVKHPGLAKMQKRFDETWACQLGSLGGGNHFIELCVDDEDRLWVMLHSGSRGVGNAMGRYFIERARRELERADRRLPDRDLAWLDEGTALFDDYVEAVGWAQDYALANRREMMRLITDVLRRHLPSFGTDGEAINCHHNYVARERHFGEDLFITRKGAIRAGAGELGIIPGSVGARSFIVRGLGNEESYCSCAHGAGRRMSRTEAKRRFSREDLARQTEGVECRKDGGVIDEIPAAYKSDLVEIVRTLKQVVCVKG
jgi:tRNA-splicing ligase RtcB (3'-phosphate/5'-hydroxy nucleic acid ligase)